MKTLLEKFERMVVRILEALDIEQGNADTVSGLNTDAHHTLIDPCW